MASVPALQHDQMKNGDASRFIEMPQELQDMVNARA